MGKFLSFVVAAWIAAIPVSAQDTIYSAEEFEYVLVLASELSTELGMTLAESLELLSSFGAFPEPSGFGAYPEPSGFGAYPEPSGFGAYPEPSGFGAYPEPSGLAFGSRSEVQACEHPSSIRSEIVYIGSEIVPGG